MLSRAIGDDRAQSDPCHAPQNTPPQDEMYLMRLAETCAIAAGAERRFVLERRHLEREQARAMAEALVCCRERRKGLCV